MQHETNWSLAQGAAISCRDTMSCVRTDRKDIRYKRYDALFRENAVRLAGLYPKMTIHQPCSTNGGAKAKQGKRYL